MIGQESHCRAIWHSDLVWLCTSCRFLLIIHHEIMSQLSFSRRNSSLEKLWKVWQCNDAMQKLVFQWVATKINLTQTLVAEFNELPPDKPNVLTDQFSISFFKAKEKELINKKCQMFTGIVARKSVFPQTLESWVSSSTSSRLNLDDSCHSI